MRMLLYCAEAFENGVRVVPDLELEVDDFRELVEGLEKSIVEPEAAEELPDSLDRIELWAVRGRNCRTKSGSCSRRHSAWRLA
jgi:hypothetical protein